MATDNIPKTKISIDAVLESLTVIDSPHRLKLWETKGWQVETNCGTEFIEVDLVPETAEVWNDREDAFDPAPFEDYIEGTEATSAILQKLWCAQWTMPGYLDMGTLHTAEGKLSVLESLLDDLGDYDDNGMIDNVVRDALQQLVGIANEKRFVNDPFGVRSKRALEIICRHLPGVPRQQPVLSFDAHADLPAGVCYSGDMNPVDHDGTWMDTRDWDDYGYADALAITSAENRLWIEHGTVHRPSDTVKMFADIQRESNPPLDKADITKEHQMDWVRGQHGMEPDAGGTAEYTRLDGGWFLDAGGNFVCESQLESIISEWINNKRQTEGQQTNGQTQETNSSAGTDGQS